MNNEVPKRASRFSVVPEQTQVFNVKELAQPPRLPFSMEDVVMEGGSMLPPPPPPIDEYDAHMSGVYDNHPQIQPQQIDNWQEQNWGYNMQQYEYAPPLGFPQPQQTHLAAYHQEPNPNYEFTENLSVGEIITLMNKNTERG